LSEVVFFLTTLHGEEVREQYETWVREIDTPTAVALPGVTSYRVVRLEQPVMDGTAAPSYSYIEIIEITDLATYQASIGSTPASFFDQFRSYIKDFEAVAGRFVN
jgi:hypothetical protein